MRTLWILASFSLILTFFSFDIHKVFFVDCDALGNLELPNDDEWQQVLIKNREQIKDGPRDRSFLNSCYRGGFNRCYRNFVSQNEMWNYQKIKKEKPWLLGGNMTDTDRVAGQLGWKDASWMLEKHLRTQDASTIRRKIWHLNLAVYLLFLPLVLITLASYKTFKHLQSVQFSNATKNDVV